MQGRESVNILEGSVADTPMIVIDKDIIAVSISDVYLDSHDFVLYTDCEVYMPAGYTNKVDGNF